MSGIKTKLRRLKYWLKHSFLSSGKLILWLMAGACLMFVVLAIGAMDENWQLAEEISEERRELALLKIEAEVAELENEYYASDEYQELLARRLLDKQLEGEQMVVLPENSEAAKNKHQEKEAATEENGEVSNLERWWKYLFPEN